MCGEAVRGKAGETVKFFTVRRKLAWDNDIDM